MRKVRIKICGLTRDEDVKDVVSLGVDAVGFVFTNSPRRVSPETASRLVGYVPDSVLRVGLFLNQQRSEIEQVLELVSLDVLQFHGSESAQECSAFGLPWLKAVAMQDGNSVKRAELEFPGAMGLLLDSHVLGGQGGSGKVFDWSLSAPVDKPVWLAGGLNAENVGEAIRVVRPYAVDVSSGVEAKPGIKDSSRVGAFVHAVRVVESEVFLDGR